MIIDIDITDSEVLLNLGDSNNVNQVNNLHARKKLSSLDSCSHGGIYSTKNYLKVKIDFSSNVNPLGISRQVLKEIRKNIKQISHIYPDSNCNLLKKNIADYTEHGIDKDWISVGNGATELIHNFAKAVSLKNSIIIYPTFCEYELASKRCGMKIDYIPLSKKLQIQANLVIEKSKINPNSLIFICNPNNPTGQVNTDIIEKIVSCIDSSKTILLLDESFIEFLNDIERKSLISKIKEYKNLAILRSMTKSYGLAGLRLGYLIAHPHLIQKLKSFQIPWSVNGIAQIAGIAALKDQVHISRAKKIIQKERNYMYNTLNKKESNTHALRSDVNFFLIKLKNINSIAYQKTLLNIHGILVRDCSSFTGMSTDFIRVAVRTHRDNVTLLKAIYDINNNLDKYKLLKN
ncbi:MAG TPA: histidinol-phosphate transaminase [Nitrososphaeraceae archaeon]|nr:histidinol-phosphate transaminase [Nitrososphaeraceae archaeon]